jgi:hypothetical protein
MVDGVEYNQGHECASDRCSVCKKKRTTHFSGRCVVCRTQKCKVCGKPTDDKDICYYCNRTNLRRQKRDEAGLD